MKELRDKLLFKLVVLRGLGYKQKEIAKILSVSQTTVAYRLGKLRELAVRRGIEEAFRDIVCEYISCPTPVDTVCMPRCVYNILTEKIKESEWKEVMKNDSCLSPK